jgi:hypothetical protein
MAVNKAAQTGKGSRIQANTAQAQRKPRNGVQVAVKDARSSRKSLRRPAGLS